MDTINKTIKETLEKNQFILGLLLSQVKRCKMNSLEWTGGVNDPFTCAFECNFQWNSGSLRLAAEFHVDRADDVLLSHLMLASYIRVYYPDSYDGNDPKQVAAFILDHKQEMDEHIVAEILKEGTKYLREWSVLEAHGIDPEHPLEALVECYQSVLAANGGSRADKCCRGLL